MPPALLYGCETWTLNRDLRWRLHSFGTRSLQRIPGYHWSDFVSNERLLRETQIRFVTCIVRECQLRLDGMWLVFLMLILLIKLSQRWSLVSGGGQWADSVPRGCSRLISSRWDGPGSCLGDGQMEAHGVPVDSGRSYMLLWRMLPYLT